jgi:hypothetical protein
MAILMHVTGTYIPGQTKRKACFTFRPALPNETKNILKINYGTGCSATV